MPSEPFIPVEGLELLAKLWPSDFTIQVVSQAKPKLGDICFLYQRFSPEFKEWFRSGFWWSLDFLRLAAFNVVAILKEEMEYDYTTAVKERLNALNQTSVQ